MHMQSFVMWFALAIAIGIPVFLFRRGRNLMRGLNAYLAERGFTARDTSPIAALTTKNPPDGFYFSAAYAGTAQNVAMTVLILRRSESVVSQGVSMQTQTIYIGVHVPTIGPRFVADWQRKAQAKQENVVHVSEPAEGGALVVWKGAPSRANVESHVAAVAASARMARA